jgi:hypothetical protein
MNNAELAERLVSIARLNHDLIHAYDEAISKVDKSDKDICDHLIRFRNDHHRQEKAIVEAIEDLGQEPPRFTEEKQEFETPVLRSLENASGTAGVLEALQRNEYFTNKMYDEAVADDYYTTYPLNIQALLQRNYLDERRHQAYIDSQLGQLVGVG